MDKGEVMNSSIQQIGKQGISKVEKSVIKVKFPKTIILIMLKIHMS